MSSVACCMLHVACCMLPPGAHALEASSCASARARNVQARTLFVGMAVTDEVVGRTASVAHARSVNWPQPPHILCTAAAPHPSLQSSVGLQLEKIAAAGNGAEKSLLADVTEKNPDVSYIDLLRLFKVHRSVADGHS